jgi:hypothetical protein
MARTPPPWSERIGPVRLSFPGLFRLVLAYFISHNTIKSAEICRLFHQLITRSATYKLIAPLDSK